MNCLISLNFLCKEGNRIFPRFTSGIFLTLHIHGYYDVLDDQFDSKQCLSVARLYQGYEKQQHYVKFDSNPINFAKTFKFPHISYEYLSETMA